MAKMKSKKEIQEYLAYQLADEGEALPINESTKTRALVAINNTSVVIAELLLDIRELLKKKKV